MSQPLYVNFLTGQPLPNIIDNSSVAGSGSAFFNPSFFGNPGKGIIHSFNRVKIGTATLSDGSVPQSTPDWLESLGQSFSSEAQLVSISTLGTLGTVGASRSSDFRSWTGGVTGGAQGITGFGYNDDTGAGSPIAVGVYGVGIRKSGVAGITLNQLDVCNAGSVVDVNPDGGVVGSTCFALGLTAGAFGSLATANVSAGLYFGAGSTTKFRKGAIFFGGALDTAVGAGGNGLAIEMARGMSVRWLHGTSTVDTEMWGNASGLNVTTAAVLLNGYTFLVPSAAGAATPYNIMDDSAGNNSIILGGGGASPDATSYYRNTKHQFAGISGAGSATQIDATSGIYTLLATAIPAGGAASVGFRMSSTSNFGIFFGSGAPAMTAAKGSLYLRSDGTQNNRLYIATDSVGNWTTFNTIA